MTKNVSEIHDFVHQLMSSDLINDKMAKVQLVRNLANCFDGLEGSDEELILISILQIILSRLQPQDEDEIERTDSERKKTILRKRNLHVKAQLKEWQEVMFEAAIPELLFKFIDVKGDQFLANKALTLLNGIMF
jgi:FtsZ-binding cell division protein ZapB